MKRFENPIIKGFQATSIIFIISTVVLNIPKLVNYIFMVEEVKVILLLFLFVWLVISFILSFLYLKEERFKLLSLEEQTHQSWLDKL